MLKEYLNVEAQVELLRSRGMACDARTARILLREGYYAVVNGYGKPFLDERASQEAGEDRFLRGTEFAHVYDLFRFDRALRSLTFSQLTQVEGMLRSLATGAFLEAHPEPDSYLQEQNYCSAQQYLLSEGTHRRDLRHLTSTLSRYANDHEHDERGRDDARLAHYREHYDAVPLWVVFSDFSYGNLLHFVALMRPNEQAIMCRNLSRALDCGEDHRPCSRRELVDDMRFQVEVRNMCAHGERLYDAVRYDRFARMMGRYLTDKQFRQYLEAVRTLVAQFSGKSPVLDHALATARMRGADAFTNCGDVLTNR